MIKNLTVSVTDRCNGKCLFCNISRNFKHELTVDQFSQLVGNPIFANIETLSLSGGEMFLHPEIEEIMAIALQQLKGLQRIFINTNGFVSPHKVAKLLLMIPSKIQCIVSISFEGGTEENLTIRGYDNTEFIVTLANMLKSKPNVSISLSMTLCEVNCSLKSLHGTKTFAEKLNCDYSFRLSEVSEMYYKNGDYSFTPTDEQIQDIISFIHDYCQDNMFLTKYAEFLQTKTACYGGKVQKCIAGSILAFVNADGNVYPCIYANKPIGRINSEYLSSVEPISHCSSCFTDCISWPMIEYYELGAYQ